LFQSLSLVGRLGTDPELRYTPSGTPVCNFNVATDIGYGDNKKTVWFKVTAWRKTAEVANQYLAKGDTVAVQGEVDVESYTTQSGEARASLVVTANNLSFVQTQGRGDQGQNQSAVPAAAAPATPAEDVEELPW
jgi:single-strand DNA-binding protein